MRTRPLGQSGIEATVVAFGAWAIGGWMWGGTDEDAAVAGVRAAIDEGITLIDSAAIYGFGLSEELVGKAIAGRRDEVVIATKCGLVWHTDKGTPSGEGEGHVIYRYLEPESVKYEVEQSLKRLGTDRIDLYQTHWQDDTTPIADTMGALLELKAEGKIRAIGVCNASIAQMEEYRAVGPLDSDQEQYNMLDRKMDAEQLPFCKEKGLAFLAYSPMARGLLTGKIGPDRRFKGDDHRGERGMFSGENRERVLMMLEQLRPIADARGLTFAQLALAWTAQQPGVTHVLAGTRNPQQARENAAAGDVVLSDGELEAVEEAIKTHAGGE